MLLTQLYYVTYKSFQVPDAQVAITHEKDWWPLSDDVRSIYLVNINILSYLSDSKMDAVSTEKQLLGRLHSKYRLRTGVSVRLGFFLCVLLPKNSSTLGAVFLVARDDGTGR